ncbi:MAG TPA: hypothetical protein VGN07_22440 [Steroidobacteraceae bacterium]
MADPRFKTNAPDFATEWKERPARNFLQTVVWAGLFLFGWDMIQNGEYAVAELLFTASATAYFWQVISARVNLRTKTVFAICGTIAFSLCAVDGGYFIRGDRPWSNIPFSSAPQNGPVSHSHIPSATEIADAVLAAKAVHSPLYNSNLRVAGFSRPQYEVGKRLAVNVYLQYDGDAPAHRRMAYSIIPLEDFVETDANEETVWQAYGDAPALGSENVITIPPKQPTYGTLLSQFFLKEEMVQALASPNTSSAIVVMGTIRWTEGTDKTEYVTEFCMFMRHAPVFFSCLNHNGPVRQSDTPKVLEHSGQPK